MFIQSTWLFKVQSMHVYTKYMFIKIVITFRKKQDLILTVFPL